MAMSNTRTNTMMLSYFQKRRVRPPTAATELPESVLAQCPPKIILQHLSPKQQGRVPVGDD